MANSGGRFFNRLETKVFFIILLTTLTAAAVVFAVTSTIFYGLLLEDVSIRTRTANQYAQTVIKPESFALLNTQSDSARPEYAEQQGILNSIREIANVRYLFSAKRDAEGRIMYVTDGLNLGADDFRFIGDPVEEEILPQLNACLRGEIIESGSVMETSWGPILLTCWPLRDDNQTVVGAVVMEFDAMGIHDRRQEATFYSIIISLVIGLVCIGLARVVLRKVSVPYYKKLAYLDYLTGLSNRMAFELDLQNLESTVREQKVVSIVVYDLNDLKEINDTKGHSAGDAYLKRMASLIVGIFPNVRENYRLGGDEFATVVRGQDCISLDALLNDYFNRTLCTSSLENYFSFSFGVATFDPAQDTSLRDVFNRADRNMYVFKAHCKLNRKTEEAALLI